MPKSKTLEEEILEMARLLVATNEKYQQIKKPHLRQATYRLAFELGKAIGKKEIMDNRKIEFYDILKEA